VSTPHRRKGRLEHVRRAWGEEKVAPYRESRMKALLVVLMSAVMLLTTTAQAMEIQQFDKMAGDDQIRFVDQLAQSVEDASTRDPNLLAHVKRFFMPKQPGEDISGMGRFELNLSLARVADLQTAEKNPKARRLEVEDVLYATLERSGVVLSKSFRPAAPNFQTQKPLCRDPATSALGGARRTPLTREEADKALAQTQAWVARTVQERTFRPGSHGPSGSSDNENVIAFFAALMLIRAAASDAGGPSTQPSTEPSRWRPWWEEAGYPSYHDAAKATCLENVFGKDRKSC
jgi:hypothetical protein